MTEQLKSRRAEIGDYYRAKREAEIFWREKCLPSQIDLPPIELALDEAYDILNESDYAEEEEVVKALNILNATKETIREFAEDWGCEMPDALVNLFEQLFAKEREIVELKSKVAELEEDKRMTAIFGDPDQVTK